MTWQTIYEDTNQRVEQDDTGAQRVTYANPVEDSIRKQAAAALSVNATFLGIAAPSQAQSLAQIRALTRQVNALIRMELDDYSADA